MTSNQRISLGKVLPTSLLLTLAGAGGLFLIFINTQPFIGPRWLMFFFTTLLTSGISLPFFTIIQHRFSRKGFTEAVIVRESIFFAIFIDLVLWLQLGRALNNLILILLAIGFSLLEIFLRISEKAVFDPGED